MQDTPPPPAYVTVLPALMPAAPSEDGWTPLEHLVSPNGGDFYTADQGEVASVVASLHYTDKGPVGYIYRGVDGALPLRRYYSKALAQHYYTTGDAPATGDWVAEGNAGYLAHGDVTEPGIVAIPVTVRLYVMRPQAVVMLARVRR